MSTGVQTRRRSLATEEVEPRWRETAEGAGPEPVQTDTWDRESFFREQIRGLVRLVFFPGWPRPVRQVVFSAVDSEVDIAPICARVGETLATQVPVNVCLVEANLRAPGLKRLYGGNRSDGPSCQEEADAERKSSRQISHNLWLESWEVFPDEDGLSAVWLQDQLRELSRRFEYVVLHAPPAGVYSETALLAQLADGVVLVLEAHSTRRAAAQRVKDTLQASNARLLGWVLSERTFPIPDRIYRKL